MQELPVILPITICLSSRKSISIWLEKVIAYHSNLGWNQEN